jgi:hypothetical protein
MVISALAGVAAQVALVSPAGRLTAVTEAQAEPARFRPLQQHLPAAEVEVRQQLLVSAATAALAAEDLAVVQLPPQQTAPQIRVAEVAAEAVLLGFWAAAMEEVGL